MKERETQNKAEREREIEGKIHELDNIYWKKEKERVGERDMVRNRERGEYPRTL